VARDLQLGLADLEVAPALGHGRDRLLQRQVVLLEGAKLGVEELQRLFIAELGVGLLAQVRTSSTRAPSRPDASLTRIRRWTAVAEASLRTWPVSASEVML
jgi:hypothetical protein